MATKTLAKSLHTVSVLVNIATDIKTRYPHGSNASCITAALGILGYDDCADPHNLMSSALRQMDKATK